MALLGNNTMINPGTSFYATAAAPAPPTPVISAEGFIATGGATAGPVGQFISVGDSAAGGVDCIQMKRPAPSNALQWGIGMAGIPTGTGDVGNDFAIYSYHDNGTFSDVALAISRATGDVSVGNLAAADISGANMELTGNLNVAGTITGNIAVPGGWATYFNETNSEIDLPADNNFALFTIPLPPQLQNATKYTIRVSDINIPLVQASQLNRVLVYFDWNLARNGVSYTSGGAFEYSACDNNWIWLDNYTALGGSALQSGTSFTNPDGAPLNSPAAPYSNNAYYAGAAAPSGGYNPSLAALNLPVFNLWNYNGDAVSQIYLVFNPDPHDGSQAVGSMPAGARLRCIVEASFAPQYQITP